MYHKGDYVSTKEKPIQSNWCAKFFELINDKNVENLHARWICPQTEKRDILRLAYVCIRNKTKTPLRKTKTRF